MNCSLNNSITDNRKDRRNRHSGLVVRTLSLLAIGGLAVGCTSDRNALPISVAATATGDTIPVELLSASLVDQALESSDPQSDIAEEAAFESGNFPGVGPYDNPEDGTSGGGDDNGEGNGAGPVDIPPGPQAPPAPPSPCDNLVADGSSLVVYPDPVTLDSNDMDGEFAVINCSDGDVDWTAAVNPKVSLSTADGMTLPGESTPISFTIDADAYGNGAIDFKIKVSEPNHSQYVDVHAFNPRLGWESVAGNGTLSGGQGVGGCSNDCIVSAVLRSNVQTPNVSLDVTTDTPAQVRVWVSTNNPSFSGDIPTFPGVDPIDTSAQGATAWTADLSPLQASTNYFIIVSATDADGEVSYRHGTFRTRSPFEAPGGFADAGGDSGCATQCITSAILSPGSDYTASGLAVRSHTPAMFQASASTEAPTFDGATPSFSAADVWVNSGLQYGEAWDTTLVGLTSDTLYHIIVKAEDAQGRTSYRVGQFRSQSAPTVDLSYTMLGIKVNNDGDKHSAGELSFGWQVGNDLIAWENAGKVDDAMSGLYTFTFGEWSSTWQVSDVAGFIPPVVVSAYEWDWNGNPFDGSSCNDVPQSVTTSGFDGDCIMKWNVADSGIIGVDTVVALAPCTDYAGFDGRGEGLRCMLLTSESLGDDYPSISALVAIEIV